MVYWELGEYKEECRVLKGVAFKVEDYSISEEGLRKRLRLEERMECLYGRLRYGIG